MSELKALKKLRKLDGCIDMPMLKDKLCADTNTHNVIAALEAIADEIEAEIAERYQLLPVDAEGVPLKVGQTVYGKYLEGNPEFTVRGFSFDLEHGQWNVQTSAATWTSANLLSHFKPRTIESILEEYGDACERYGMGEVDRAMYADEIRELMGGEK